MFDDLLSHPILIKRRPHWGILKINCVLGLFALLFAHCIVICVVPRELKHLIQEAFAAMPGFDMRKERLEYVHVRIFESRDNKRDWSEHLVALPVLFQGRLAARGALWPSASAAKMPGTGVVGEWKDLSQALRSEEVGGGGEIRTLVLPLCDPLWHFLALV